MAFSGSIAGPDITGIGSAIGAIADEASEVMNEFDRPNVRYVEIHKYKNRTIRVEYAFSKFDAVFYSIFAGCIIKGIQEQLAGGSFYDWVKEELASVLNSLRSEIQKMVAGAGIGGWSALFGGTSGYVPGIGVGGNIAKNILEESMRDPIAPIDADAKLPAEPGDFTQQELIDTMVYFDMKVPKTGKIYLCQHIIAELPARLAKWAQFNQAGNHAFDGRLYLGVAMMNKYATTCGVTWPLEVPK